MNPDLIDYGFLLVLCVGQAVRPRRAYGLLKQEWRQDLMWVAAGALVPRALDALQLEPSSWLRGRVPAVWSLAGQPAVLQFVVAILAWDFATYWVHRWMHRVPALWELHKAHHSTVELTAVSGDRGGFLQNLVGDVVTAVPLLLLGIDFRIVALLGLVFSLQGHLVHANLKYGRGPTRFGARLSPWLCTPHYHHWHHAEETRHPGGQNFGTLFPFWDRLFGTQVLDPVPPARLGFVGLSSFPEGFLARYFHPLRLPVGRRAVRGTPGLSGR